MKKFWAILLAMMLVLGMATVAGATEVENPSTGAEGFTITVNPKDDVDHEYQVYQIFTADVETNAGVKVLTSVKWGTNDKNDTDAVRTGDPVPDAVLDALKAVSGTNQEKLAEITKYWNADSTPVDTFASTKAAPGTSKKLTPGYYLVRDNQAKLEGKDGAATLLIVKVLDQDIVATAKSEKPSVDKQVQDEVGDAEKNGGEVNPEGWGESADHALFENFKFRLVATIPVNADYNDYPTYKLVFNDTMSKGITFVQIDSVKVNGIALKDTDYVCTATPGQKGAGKVGENQDKPSWTLTIEDLKKVMRENTSILVTDKITVEVVYTAYLNEEAQVFNASATSTDNKNSVDLEYSNNPNAGGMGGAPGGAPGTPGWRPAVPMPARPAVAPGFCPKEVAAAGAVAPSRSYWAESSSSLSGLSFGKARRIFCRNSIPGLLRPLRIWEMLAGLTSSRSASCPGRRFSRSSNSCNFSFIGGIFYKYKEFSFVKQEKSTFVKC